MSRKMSFTARCLWIACRGVALMPRVVQYHCIGSVIYFIMRYILRYRRSLILKQLTDSFPERSKTEIRSICNDYYHTLAETVVGTMTLASMNRRMRREVLKVEVSDSVREAVEGKNFVYFSSHHNFWEYAQFAGLCFPGHMTVCAYHPLKSKVWDELYYHLRENADCKPVPSSELIRYFLRHKDSGIDNRRLLLGLIADQNSPPKGEVHWYNFLNHKTLFFEGGEQMALKFKMPVLYLSMSRIKAGRYRGEVKMLYDGEQSVEKHEIMERYVSELEKDIRREPSRWMWSHRRWKYKPDPDTGEVIYCGKGY